MEQALLGHTDPAGKAQPDEFQLLARLELALLRCTDPAGHAQPDYFLFVGRQRLDGSCAKRMRADGRDELGVRPRFEQPFWVCAGLEIPI